MSLEKLTIGALSAADSITTPTLPRSPQNQRMENAAHQFEASLLHELFTPLTSDSLLSDGDAESGSTSGSGGALTGFASDAMARALSERGGFGIARKIIDHFEHPPKSSKREARTESL